jgi:methylated-DNA-[protein]-cysteine S-methyltransferase
MPAGALVIDSPLGPIRIRASEEGLLAVDLGAGSAADNHGTSPVLDRAAAQLGEYFAGERRVFDLPRAAGGTPFQRLVWDALIEIPYGQTRSYQEIAARIGRPTASRAVGAANGQNPLAIIVPCHRVVGADGTLTGYAAGVPRKEWLLRHERAII